MPGAGLSLSARRAKELIRSGDSPFLSGTRIDEVVGASTRGMAWRAEQLERQLQQTLGPRLRGVLGGDFSSRTMAAADPEGFIRDSVDRVMGGMAESSAHSDGYGHGGRLVEGHGVGDNVRASLGLRDAVASVTSLQSIANREMQSSGNWTHKAHASREAAKLRH